MATDNADNTEHLRKILQLIQDAKKAITPRTWGKTLQYGASGVTNRRVVLGRKAAGNLEQKANEAIAEAKTLLDQAEVLLYDGDPE